MTEILDPTAQLEPIAFSRTARPPNIAGQTIGLLDISKARGDVFLDEIERLATIDGATIRRYTKPTFTRTAPVDLRAQITRECTLVIEALAD